MLAILLKPINDLTTTPSAPPPFEAIAQLPAHANRALTYPPDFSEKQKKLYPELKPLPLPGTAAEIYARVLNLAKKQSGWEIIAAEASRGRIEAVATTPVFRFRDDIVIELRSEGQTTSVHMRSRSRLGRNDFGTNFKRISEFLKRCHVPNPGHGESQSPG